MRTQYCGNITTSHVGKKITVCGWVNNKRTFKKFIFIDIRDCTGIIQVFFDPKNIELFKNTIKLRHEYCIQVTGIVQNRSTKNINHNIKTGKIEIIAQTLKVFNISQKLPLSINDINDDKIRLKYRYLDLRNPEMLKNLTIRHKIINIITNFMHKNNFLNIETPILTKSTPEGAKDYLIQSRINNKKYYALSQSPQLFKQLLMISGIDKYYQIVKCFRNEDLRSDRQPEFTQIDIEASFIKSEKILNLVESMIQILWKNFLNVVIQKIPKISFSKSIQKYGTDKPDLRVKTKIINLEHIIFNQNQLHKSYEIRTSALVIKNGIYNTNINTINDYTNLINSTKNIIFNYIYVKNIQDEKKGILSSNNLFNKYYLKNIINKTCAQNGDIILIISGETHAVNNILSILRVQVNHTENIKNMWKPVWIIDFPMFKKNIDNTFSSMHHPFTAPKNTSISELKKNPQSILAQSYDLVINGYEVGGGSVRIHKQNMQKAVLEILNIDYNKKNTFEFFINALQYGTPPHAGIALGLDRLVMLITNQNNIKNVIAFPKTNSATCLMTGAPSKLTF